MKPREIAYQADWRHPVRVRAPTPAQHPQQSPPTSPHRSYSEHQQEPTKNA